MGLKANLMAVACASAAMLASGAANAASLVYNVTSTFADGGTVTGTLTLNNATGLFTSANLTATGFPISNGVYTSIFYDGPDLITGTDLDVVDYVFGSEDEFNFTPSSFVGYQALTIPVESLYFNSGFVFDNSFAQTVSVKLAPVSMSAVPEAATWAMMMVGLGVVGGSLRRRRSVNTRVSLA